LDLGCGTGTNAITLARRGWRVTGVDFVPEAIRRARKKVAGSGLAIDLHIADVTDLGMLDDAYDYVLDIGCLTGIQAKDRPKYGAELARLLRPGGCYMLYAWLPRVWQGRIIGISAEDLDLLLANGFVLERSVVGEENGHPTAWYWYRRR
jgi:SAM-dependent methyltransferase